MRIIYLEDDLIDQRLFKRACRDVENLEVTYLSSSKELEEKNLDVYDGIIVDQYLGDGSIKQFTNKKITIPMAVLSASEKLIAEHPNNLGIWQKPIQESAIKEMISKMKSSKDKNTSTISLAYIEDLTQGNEKDKQELLHSIYSNILENNNLLQKASEISKDDLQQSLHKQKSKIGIFYLEELHQQIDQAENKLKNGANKEEVLDAVEIIVQETENILLDLKKHIS